MHDIRDLFQNGERMSQQRPVPGIAKGPQGFSPRSLPPISNPMGQPPAVQQAADDVSMVDELAMEIYARLSADTISTSHIAKPELLRSLAQAAKQAAAIFFEEDTNNAQA